MGYLAEVARVYSVYLVSILSSVLLNILLARVLGPAGKGVFTYTILIPYLIFNFLHIGLGTSGIWFIKQHYEYKDRIVKSIVLYCYIAGFTAVCIMFGLIKITRTEVIIASIAIPFILVYEIGKDLLVGLDKTPLYLRTGLLYRLLPLLFIGISFLIMGDNIFSAVLAWLVAIIISGAFITVNLLSQTRGFDLPDGLKELLKGIFKYGLKVWVGFLSNFINLRADMFIIYSLTQTAYLGYYSISVSIAEMLLYLPQAVSQILLQKTSDKRITDKLWLTSISFRVILFIFILLSLILIITGRPLIILFFSNKFLSSFTPLIILLPAVIFMGLSRILYSDLCGRGRPEIIIFASPISAIINVILNFYFIKKFSIEGAALASLVSYFIEFLIILKYYLKISCNKFNNLFLLQADDLALFFSLFKKKI
ncbi:MAG: polysaccharide biosynthesis C-terminal domain-containing protein [Candidatus Hydrogenedentota bacterium]